MIYVWVHKNCHNAQCLYNFKPDKSLILRKKREHNIALLTMNLFLIEPARKWKLIFLLTTLKGKPLSRISCLTQNWFHVCCLFVNHFFILFYLFFYLIKLLVFVCFCFSGRQRNRQWWGTGREKDHEFGCVGKWEM